MWRTRALGLVQGREGGSQESAAPRRQGVVIGGVEGVYRARCAGG